MVKIRLARVGRVKRPHWRIVVMDSRKKRDGACLDNIGAYDPIAHSVVQFHEDRYNDWLSKGAQSSATVKKIVKMARKQADDGYSVARRAQRAHEPCPIEGHEARDAGAETRPRDGVSLSPGLPPNPEIRTQLAREVTAYLEG